MGSKTLILINLILVPLMLTVGCQAFASAYEYRGTLIQSTDPMPDFELMATTGQPFRLSEAKGNITLLYFGYTNCPDVCPLTMWEVKQALGQLDSGRERVQVIFVTADPERDTLEQLSQYLTVFGPEFIGLSDDIDKTEAMMKPYGASAAREESDSALGYLVSHTATLFLVDPQGYLRLQYPFGFTAEDLGADLAYLLEQEPL